MTANKDTLRKRLERERERLQTVRQGLLDEGLTESEKESLSELSSEDQHQADLGTETFERAKDLSILYQVEAEIEDVARALEQVEDGTYGVCGACGKAIAAARLEAKPAARFCVEDQARIERGVASAS